MPRSQVIPIFHVRTPDTQDGEQERLRRDIEENLNRIYQGANAAPENGDVVFPSLHVRESEDVEMLRRVCEHELKQIVRLANERRNRGTQVSFTPPSLRLPETTPELERLRRSAEVEMAHLCRQLQGLNDATT